MASDPQRSVHSREGRGTAQTSETVDAEAWPTSLASMRTTALQRRRMTPTTRETQRKRSSSHQNLGICHSDPRSESVIVHPLPNEDPLHSTPNRTCSNTPPVSSERRSSRNASIVLPHWQPDMEADECPVCETKFGWLFRRHHCRKCGRVVCSSCSQHRITIPRQYIVQPSEQILARSFSLTKTDSPNLGSADVVRVCNPCVPDPNLSPPPQVSNVDAVQRSRQRMPHYSQHADTVQQGLSGPPQTPRYSSSSSARTHQTHMRSLQLPVNYSHQILHAPSALPALPSLPASSAGPGPHNQRRSTLSGLTTTSHYSPLRGTRLAHGRGQSISGYPLTQAASAYRPRSRIPIAEEDECPVCGRELPPRDASCDDAARAQHVTDCINSYGSYQARSPSGSHMLGESHRNLGVLENTSPGSFASGSDSMAIFPEPALAPHSSSSVPSASSSMPITRDVTPLHRSPRMLEYNGTEKDCSNDLGEQQECIICFEEFQVGDNMARLECLCKFHKGCILGWWQAKTAHGGLGAEIGCPTHVLHA